MTIPLLPGQDGGCTIDLEHVPFLSSKDLTELVRFRRLHPDERIVLRRPNALVLRTLHTVGFNKLFAIEAEAA